MSLEGEEAEYESAARAALSALYGFAIEELYHYVDILASSGIEWGLLGPREGSRLWSRHIANSCALVDVIPEGVQVVDVGSGAGLPGIPLALVRPDLSILLMEPLERRVDFLNLAIDELGLADRVIVYRGRAEEHASTDGVPKVFDVVTCRAVAPLGKLLSSTNGLFYPDGELVALKGRSAEEEIRKAAKVLRSLKLDAEVLELTLAPGVSPTRAVRVRRSR